MADPEKEATELTPRPADVQLANDVWEKLQPYVIPDKRQEAGRLITQVVAAKFHLGPIPSADELRELETIQPGFADRVIRMAEREQAHRHDVEGQIVKGELGLKSKGQWLAIASLVLLLGAVCYLAYTGDTKSAAWLGGATIVAVVAIFVTGRHFDSRDNQQAQAQVAPETESPPQLPNLNLPQKSPQRRRK